MVSVLHEEAGRAPGQRHVPAEEPFPLTPRVVIDTNLLIAALKQPVGSSARILQLWREGKVELLVSDETLREAELVLGAGWLARITEPGAVDNLLRELRDRTVRVNPVKITDLPLKDKGDLDLVEAAVGGGAQFVVTADREVLLNRGYKSVEFVDSGEFLGRMQRGD